MEKMERRKCEITIGEDMTVYHAIAQKEQLIAALDGCDELELDLSQVGEMDSAGLQLLLLARREADRAGKAVHLTAHSKAVTELLDLYGMAGHFGDPLVIPAAE